MKRKRVNASRPVAKRPKGDDTGTVSVLPMTRQVGDRFTDTDGFEWEVLAHPESLHGPRFSEPGLLAPGCQRASERRPGPRTSRWRFADAVPIVGGSQV